MQRSCLDINGSIKSSKWNGTTKKEEEEREKDMTESFMV
jgi:hypothetical protein